MKRLTLAELDLAATTVEAVADSTPGIDPWCSGVDWVIPTQRAFAPKADPLILTWQPANSRLPSFALLAAYPTPSGVPLLAGLEPMWGFASPLLSANPETSMPYLVDYLRHHEQFSTIVLPGMPHPDIGSALGARIVSDLSELGPVMMGEGVTRQVIDLTLGDSHPGHRFDQWLDRRSSRFRRNLRQAVNRADGAGLRFEDVSQPNDPDGLFERLLAIEHASWKGHQDSGITTSEMDAMYRQTMAKLAGSGRLRAHVAIINGVDVGYILGGVRARRYRGLQISYTQAASRLSVGNLLQAHQLHLLCAHNEIDVYDMGMDMQYKQRWADRGDETVTFVVRTDSQL